MTSPARPAAPLRVFARLKRIERRHVADVLRAETVGGALLIVFAILGLLWANSPWRASYDTVKNTVVGPHLWHLDLSLANWAADFLLAFFFLVAGIELKHELQAGELSDPRAAVLPVVSAFCGMVVPIGVYLAVSAGHSHAGTGWAVPTATDIAFALAVLAVVGQNLRRRCARSCSPWQWSTTSARSSSSRSRTPPRSTLSRWRSRRSCWSRSMWFSGGGSPACGSTCRWAWPSGSRSMPAASTRRWPVWPSA